MHIAVITSTVEMRIGTRMSGSYRFKSEIRVLDSEIADLLLFVDQNSINFSKAFQ